MNAEDIINVTGSPAKFFTATPVAPVNRDANDKRLQRETTFLISWEALEQEKVKTVKYFFLLFFGRINHYSHSLSTYRREARFKPITFAIWVHCFYQ